MATCFASRSRLTIFICSRSHRSYDSVASTMSMLDQYTKTVDCKVRTDLRHQRLCAGPPHRSRWARAPKHLSPLPKDASHEARVPFLDDDDVARRLRRREGANLGEAGPFLLIGRSLEGARRAAPGAVGTTSTADTVLQ